MIKTQVLRLVSILIWCSLLLSIIGHSSTFGTYAAETTKTRVIVSMGDSYSAGEGITPFFDQELKLSDKVKSQNWLAHRSKKAWSGMLTLNGVEGEMSEHYDENWYFVAASGAVTGDITGKQKKEYVKDYLTESEIGVEFLDPQINIFNKLNDKGLKADYVTLTIGGNDAGFANVITSALNPVDYLCPNNLYEQFHYLFEPDDKGTRGIDTILSNLEHSYKEISSKAGSQARIIVAGYPKLLDENGKGFLVRKDSAKVIDNAISIFNNKIEQLVKKNETKYNTYFVSVESAFDGKAAYSKDEFINGVCIAGEQDLDNRSPIGAASFHPNEKGAKAYASCVQAKISELEGITPRAKPTEKPTEKSVEIPTHKPSEDFQESANQAYLEYLQDHSNWFENLGNDYTYSVAENQIALFDVNRDGLSELIFLRPTDDSNDLEISLCVLTYKDGAVKKLYDDKLINLPGAGPTYEILFSDDSNLYSVARNYPNSYVTRYDINRDTIKSVLLAESQGHGTSNPDIKYYIDGSQTTENKYQSYYDGIANSANTVLIAHHETGLDDISMSYFEACNYLKNNSKTSNNGKTTPVTFDVTKADVEVGSAIDINCTSGHNLDNGTLKSSAGEYSKCFKIYILGDRFNIIANQEGSETFSFTSENGEVGSFTLNAVKPKAAADDYSSYLGTWEYVLNGSGEPDDPYAVVTSVTFNEINSNNVYLTIFKGNIAKVCQIDVYGQIIDGKIDFSYDKDGWENSGHGTITLNEDSIHLYAEVDSYGPNARMGLSCDDTLYRS